jgi:hypothetical protein
MTQLSGNDEEAGKWDLAARQTMERCELMYASGEAVSRIRDVCRGFCEAFLPTSEKWDFSEVEIDTGTDGGGMLPSHAKETAETFGGTWWKVSQYYAAVRYKCIRQPMGLAMEKTWRIAAVSGDRDLAKDLAARYQARPPHQITAQFAMRESTLHLALAEDTAGEQALAQKLRPGYMADFPPEMIEFPLGVINRDAEVIVQAIKKHSTTFKGKWDTRKHRAWYDKQLARHPRGFRNPGTWEQCQERTKDALFSHHWVFSWWAIAWLNIARWRGMDAVFENPKVFSEWVPRELCV